MHVITSCKYEKDRMKNSREKSGNINFSDAQGQVTLWSRVGSGQISNSSKLLCMSSLPVSMKKIRSKTAQKKWQLRFPIISLWVLFLQAKGQLTPQSVVESCRI